jgi:phosphatidylglycerophosphatase A
VNEAPSAAPGRTKPRHLLYRLIVSMGGSGLIPGLRGTYGSLVTSILLLFGYLALSKACGQPSGMPGVVEWSLLLVAALIFFSTLDIIAGRRVIEVFGRKDPGAFVLDEAAGICLTMLLLPRWPGWHEALPLAIGFVAFRVFDMWKPPPIRRLEQLPAGWGILADDLLAAVYANVICQVVLWLVR